MYCALTGEYSLSELDASWLTLLSDPPIGTRFVTEHMLECSQPACETIFPDGKGDGIYQSSEFGLQDGEDSVFACKDVVCIRSRPNDACGRHNLIKEPDTTASRSATPPYTMPPYAIVTLCSVQHTWRVRRNTMKCRLFTCEVCYEVW